MKSILFLIIFITPLVFSCSNSEADERLVVMSWNVQNLFDDVDNGTEYPEYDPGNGEWNYDDFNRKTAALADVITSSVVSGPDIILLQEVENENALQHLNTANLKASGYRYVLFLPTENSAIGCGVLSRYLISEVKSHAVNYLGRVSGRNIAELDFIIDGTEPGLKIFVNHWKSKLGGAEETEPARIAASVMLNRLMRDACAVNPDLLLIAAGDYNESHDEYARRGGGYRTAIRAGSLVEDSDNLFFNPWCENTGGSYFYNGSWETIDQFFLSKSFFDASGWEYKDFNAVVLNFNSTSDGLPLKWQASSATGCSDHFPIILMVEKVQ